MSKITEKEYGYDKVSYGYDTRANLEAFKDKLNVLEPVIATDTNEILYKDSNGNLQSVVDGLSQEELKKIKDLLDKKANLSGADFTGVVSLPVNSYVSKSDSEGAVLGFGTSSYLDRTGYVGTVDGEDIVITKQGGAGLKFTTTSVEALKPLKVSGEIVGTSIELKGKGYSYIDFSRNSGKDYESRLIQDDSGLILDNVGVKGTIGKIWQTGDCPISISGSSGQLSFPNKFKIFWGTLSIAPNSSTRVTFPSAFGTDGSYTISLTAYYSGDLNEIFHITSREASTMVVRNSNPIWAECYWIVMGY